MENGIKHLIQIQFDNVHLRRGNPNVPSDLEQMPNLLNFMIRNGTVSGNHHTPLISHTANDIVTTLTGVYPDRHGIPVTNSYRVFDSNNHPSSSHSSFIYWTATDATDGKPVLVNEIGKNALADQSEMKLLHMVTSSPARTPTLTMLGDPDYFFQTTTGATAAGAAKLRSQHGALRIPEQQFRVEPRGRAAGDHPDLVRNGRTGRTKTRGGTIASSRITPICAPDSAAVAWAQGRLCS